MKRSDLLMLANGVVELCRAASAFPWKVEGFSWSGATYYQVRSRDGHIVARALTQADAELVALAPENLDRLAMLLVQSLPPKVGAKQKAKPKVKTTAKKRRT